MGKVLIEPGCRVQIRGTDLTGTVLAVNPIKSGTRGRPKTYASVILGDGKESQYSVPELKLL